MKPSRGEKSQQRFVIECVLVCLTLLLTFPETSMEASAPRETETTTQECGTAQIILLIDQSASMYRNDPNNLRYDGPLHLADILAKSYILARQRAQADPRVRPIRIELAVIQFASLAKVQVNWTPINPVDDEAWGDQRDVLEPQLDLSSEAQQALQAEISNGTNFIRASAATDELLKSTESQADGCPKRLLMVLTDGEPDQNGQPLSDEALAEHMAEVKTIVERNFPPGGNVVYVTAFNTGGPYWRRTVGYWKEISHDNEGEDPPRTQQANTFGELGDRLADIILKFLGDPSTIEIKPGRLVIPPYVERVNLTFFKAERDDIIELRDSAGLLEPSRTDVQVVITGEDGAIQTINVIRPNPGVYELTTTAEKDEFIITKQLIFVRARLAAPVAALQQFTTSTIEVQLVDSAGNPLPHYGDPKYDLQPTAKISSSNHEIPLSMAFLSTGVLQGNFTPIEGGDHRLTIEAVSFDDDNRRLEILTSSDASFDLIVDPVTVEEGDPHSVADGCAPAQYTPFEIPLTVINESTRQVAQLSVPVTWDIESQQDATLGVSGPDTNGLYALRAVSNGSGDFSFTLRASAPNPLDGQLLSFFEKVIRVNLESGRRLTFEITGLEPQAKGILLAINQFWAGFFGEPTTDVMLVGRRLFFFPQKVRIVATLTDADSRSQVNQKDLLPEIYLESMEIGDRIPGQGWEWIGNGSFVNAFATSALGRYRIALDPKTVPCGLDLTVSPSVGGNLRLILDLLELIARLVIVGGILAALWFVTWWAICRYSNPLDGFLVVVNQEGKRVWFQSIAGKSCWHFKMDNPAKQCFLVNIRISGWRGPKGEFTLKYTRLDPQTGKKQKDSRRCSLRAWQDIPLVGGCRIRHAKTQAEVPPPA